MVAQTICSLIQAHASLPSGIYLNDFVSGSFGPTIAAGYDLIGAADFNGDGASNYLLYNPATQRTALWISIETLLPVAHLGRFFPAGGAWLRPSKARSATFREDVIEGYLHFAIELRVFPQNQFVAKHANVFAADYLARQVCVRD